MNLKLNIGASPIWNKDGWCKLDHKLKITDGKNIAGDAVNIDLPDEACDVVFCSHVFEHIPHVKLPIVLSEINRVLKPGGILRILTPDLEKIARAYVEKDLKFFEYAKEEDETIRTDLGLGGMLMNFIVSPGQDTVLLDRGMNNFIAGYAHLYSYDYEMLSTILQRLGFSARKAEFNDSEMIEMRTPLHVSGFDAEWNCLNQKFYETNKLVHRMIDGKYEINFSVTGFDRDPITSLIVEAKKIRHVDKSTANDLFNNTNRNYNRYANSLLMDQEFMSRAAELTKIQFKNNDI